MIKTGEFDNLEKMAMKKRHEIKSLNKTDNLVNVKKSKSNLQLKKHNVTNTNSQYGPFLHIVSNTKKIEIKLITEREEKTTFFCDFFSFLRE